MKFLTNFYIWRNNQILWKNENLENLKKLLEENKWQFGKKEYVEHKNKNCEKINKV